MIISTQDQKSRSPFSLKLPVVLDRNGKSSFELCVLFTPTLPLPKPIERTSPSDFPESYKSKLPPLNTFWDTDLEIDRIT